jgi:hypothetical protein
VEFPCQPVLEKSSFVSWFESVHLDPVGIVSASWFLFDLKSYMVEKLRGSIEWKLAQLRNGEHRRHRAIAFPFFLSFRVELLGFCYLDRMHVLSSTKDTE